MKLTGEQFQEIISQLVSDHQDEQQDKRREPPRRHPRPRHRDPLDDGRNGVRQTRITIRDLSRGGICILTPSAMPKGTRFILRLLRVQQTMLLAHYEVRYSKPLTNSLYSIGAKLVNIAESSVDAGAA